MGAATTRLRTRYTSWRVLACAVGVPVLIACSSTNQNGGGGVQSKGDTVYSLDLSKTRVVQPIESAEKIEPGFKFVQIEVTSVVNPKKHALTFDVAYQPAGAEQIHLGSFSLFPSDMPGTFIVATQGRVKSGGSIVLSMATPDSAHGDSVRVSVKRLSFLKG